MSKEVQSMFHSIAARYDCANDVLSFGMHRLWRKKAISLMNFSGGETVIDICCGTGDLAFAAAAGAGSEGRVYGLDFVHRMVSLAAKKNFARDSSTSAPVYLLQGDALRLPFPTGFADAATIGFGIRNVDNPQDGLKEIARTLRSGGKLMVLEFGQPTLPVFKQIYTLYSRYLMPAIGGILTGNKQAYEYLPETSAAFPAGERFLDMMKRAGLQDVRAVPLLFGLAYMYFGIKG